MPKSFISLLLSGFLFVSLPLLAALYGSMKILDSLLLKSNTTVYRSVDLATSSQQLAELLQDEERKARMYSVLNEPSQLQLLNDTHQNIANNLDHLLSFNKEGKLPKLIRELKQKEDQIIKTLNNQTENSSSLKRNQDTALSSYKEISVLKVNILNLTNKIMFDEVEELKLLINKEKEKLIWQTSYLLSFAVIIIIVFMVLLSKPIRQIDNSIERLGEGNFSIPIDVSGPRDLENLGLKLDWLRKRLLQLDKEKIKLVAHISHELKTPLASIKEGISLLKDELIGPMSNEQKEVVKILDKNYVRLQDLIENILNFNMAQARQVPYEKNHVKLKKVIKEVVSDHQNSILAKNIKLDLQLEEGTRVFGNYTQLKAVFDNLLSNAVKFTPEGGAINIRLKTDGRFASCYIEDSGKGIDEEDRSQIFIPFYKGKYSVKGAIKGSGLGLAISKEYVHHHNGAIKLLKSKRGARFLVTLPIS